MSHVVVPNYQPFAQTDPFNVYWKLSRALLAAGWKYKASADATGAAKETTGDFSKERWGVGGGVNLVQVGAQTGTAPQIAAASNGTSIITLVSGFVANSVGRFLTISGALNAGNNGTFRITAQAGTSVTVWNPSAVLETGGAITLWTEKQGGAVASVAAAGTAGAVPGRAILTGLTGMVAPTTTPLSRGSVGDRITVIGAATGANNGTFMITRVLSSTSVEIDNASATSDANNAALIWAECSPLAQTYPLSLQGTNGLGAWLDLQGPSTMRIPVGVNVPTGAFVKGEVVNQTTTGAQGVITGLCLDTVGGLGYIVVEPRLNGTGAQATGQRGWNASANTDTITGASSGATITTPVNSVPVEYVRETVLWKNTNLLGHMFHQCVDAVGESASRFSALAALAGTTTAIAPGGATGSFPLAGSYVSLGTGGSNAAGTGSCNWFGSTNTGITTTLGNGQILCANCIEGSGVSADGSWVNAAGNPTTSPAVYLGHAFQRCDDGEEGDVDPYVTWMPSAASGSYPMLNSTRTTSGTGQSGNSGFEMNSLAGGGLFTPYKGWRRRGFPTGDAYQEFMGLDLGAGTSAGSSLVATNPTVPGKVATQASPNIFVEEPIWVASTQALQKMRKGRLRWLVITEGGVANTSYAVGTWVQLGTGLNGPVVAGPWDGQTTATNA